MKKRDRLIRSQLLSLLSIKSLNKGSLCLMYAIMFLMGVVIDFDGNFLFILQIKKDLSIA